MVCTWAIPGTCASAFAILLITRKSAGFRISWSVSIIITSGFILASEKCRVAAAYPTLADTSGGRYLRSL